MEMNEQHKLGVHGFQDIYRTTIISPDNSRSIFPDLLFSALPLRPFSSERPTFTNYGIIILKIALKGLQNPKI